jgi:hypothetical protein
MPGLDVKEIRECKRQKKSPTLISAAALLRCCRNSGVGMIAAMKSDNSRDQRSFHDIVTVR